MLRHDPWKPPQGVFRTLPPVATSVFIALSRADRIRAQILSTMSDVEVGKAGENGPTERKGGYLDNSPPSPPSLEETKENQQRDYDPRLPLIPGLSHRLLYGEDLSELVTPFGGAVLKLMLSQGVLHRIAYQLGRISIWILEGPKGTARLVSSLIESGEWANWLRWVASPEVEKYYECLVSADLSETDSWTLLVTSITELPAPLMDYVTSGLTE